MDKLIHKVKEALHFDTKKDERLICKHCEADLSKKSLMKHHMICTECGSYFRIAPRDRIKLICDDGTFKEMFSAIESKNFLDFPKYDQKLAQAKEQTNEKEAVLCGRAKIGNVPACIFVMDSRFIMASMGSAVGEKITRLFEYATKQKLPVVGFCCSGGARMQESILSLMQMAKVSGAVQRHGQEGNLYLPVLTDPTTGGVTASFAMQGDIILAEPKALVGFAGKRVIQQTANAAFPDHFQTAEFLLEHGFLDAIVERENMKETITLLCAQHRKAGRTA
ncbi:MAG: acetyl-CoA carboxylase, carboxyltransferase subunit beta [Oscillospiraceae bacterium]|nr:acetyl-CoA carboxylase, carboxyltransferase subunit beta [Oscillospiraceae bacterium]